jgi:hypothetical protein
MHQIRRFQARRESDSLLAARNKVQVVIGGMPISDMPGR